jgi:hypothetical protein
MYDVDLHCSTRLPAAISLTKLSIRKLLVLDTKEILPAFTNSQTMHVRFLYDRGCRPEMCPEESCNSTAIAAIAKKENRSYAGGGHAE